MENHVTWLFMVIFCVFIYLYLFIYLFILFLLNGCMNEFGMNVTTARLYMAEYQCSKGSKVTVRKYQPKEYESEEYNNYCSEDTEF